MLKLNLKALSEKDVESFVKDSGLPAYRAKQLLHWIYERRVTAIRDITEFSKSLRENLDAVAYISCLRLLNRQRADDGTEKFLFGLEDGESIESVLIPDKDRLTLCISTQVGCAMGCRFCLTGTLGLIRDLKAHEIADQFITASSLISPRKITNVVLMGMGEPLANCDEVVEALRRMTDLVHISKRRITVSTAGIASKIPVLADAAPAVNLAVSLNATTDAVRSRLMPVNKAYPLNVLLNACRKFPLGQRRRITFEYVLIRGINDSAEDAQRLVKLIRGIPAKVNLIPLNPYTGCGYQSPSGEAVLSFQQILVDNHVTALLRKSKGGEILAACGQLKARYRQELR